MNKISVLVPAFNEQEHIEKVITRLKNCNIIDEIIVIDNNSTDNTNAIAQSLGVNVVFCLEQGKGYAMEKGLEHATGDIIVYLDADISNYSCDVVKRLVKPIIKKDYDFVKGDFTRTGGRVTELVAKPLLELLFEELSKFNQPLSGLIAGKKEILKKITFDKEYGVDVGILIDLYKLNAKIEQVHLGEIINDSQNWHELTFMSREVMKAIFKRI